MICIIRSKATWHARIFETWCIRRDPNGPLHPVHASAQICMGQASALGNRTLIDTVDTVAIVIIPCRKSNRVFSCGGYCDHSYSVDPT